MDGFRNREAERLNCYMYGSIYQNLIDAGCDRQTAEQCMMFAKGGQFTDMLPILVRHRKDLLGSLHESQKRIDCLDYLLYKVKNFTAG